MRKVFFFLWLFASVWTNAEELLRPQTIDELVDPRSPEARETTAEEAVWVPHVQVAWANYAALQRDFPQLAQMSPQQIDTWLVQNYSYIGSQQSRLNGIRNTQIPTAPERPSHSPRIAFRPFGWVRSAVLEVYQGGVSPSASQVTGLIDIKGFGHGAQGLPGDRAVDAQVAAFNRIHSQHPQPGPAQDQALDRLRTADHSDGLMSLGEAVAEVSRQSAAQRLFEMSGLDLATVDSYAILALPFHILRSGGQQLRAALYLRQAHRGRHQNLAVPPTLYVDPHGLRQHTDQNAAVDFGGVRITDTRLTTTFGDPQVDPQQANPWRLGHEVATQWENGDRGAIERHVRWMLAPLDRAYAQSPEAAENFQYRERARNFIREMERLSLPYSERVWHFSRWKAEQPETLASINHGLRSNDPEIRLAAAMHLRYRLDAASVPLLEQTLRDADGRVKRAGIDALSMRYDSAARPLIEQSLLHPTPEIVQAARIASSWHQLAQDLQNPDLDIREEAATRLRFQMPGMPFPWTLFERALQDSSDSVRRLASRLLSSHASSTSQTVGLRDACTLRAQLQQLRPPHP